MHPETMPSREDLQLRGREALVPSASRNRKRNCLRKLRSGGSSRRTAKTGTHKVPSNVTGCETRAANRGRRLAAGVIAGAWKVVQVFEMQDAGSVASVGVGGTPAEIERKLSTRARPSGFVRARQGSRGPSLSFRVVPRTNRETKELTSDSIQLDGGCGREAQAFLPHQISWEGKRRGRKRRDLAVSRLLMAEMTADRRGVPFFRRRLRRRYCYVLDLELL